MSEHPKIIAWSYSAMNTFDTCPRQYYAKYVSKECPFVQNAAAKWGDDVHKAFEDAIKYGSSLPANMVMYQKFLDAVRYRADKLGGELIAERPVALTRDLKSVSCFTKKTAKEPVWFRLKVDVSTLVGDYAELLDWKTGKMKDDPDQLHLYALVVFILHPEINKANVGYVWLKDGVLTPPVTYHRSQMPEMLAYWVAKYEVLEEAFISDNFPPKPSGLCHGWCEVTSCRHNKNYSG